VAEQGLSMKIINLFGGPGAGKTTLAYYLAYRFKQAGFRAELVGEAAREIIYDRNPPSLGSRTADQLTDNQFLISGLQSERIQRLQRHGIEIAIADSPLLMGLMYVNDTDMRKALWQAINAFQNTMPAPSNIFCRRTAGQYDKESRAQSETEAILIDNRILKTFDFDPKFSFVHRWGQEADTFAYLLQEAKRGWN